MKNFLKNLLKISLRYFGKRITNLNAPAKPFTDGVAFLKEFIKTPDWIIDIGAADGTDEVTTSYPIGEYHYLLVDPAPEFSDYLGRMQENYPETVRTEKCFCGESEGVVQLNMNKTGHYASRYVSSGLNEPIQVPMRTLDQLAEKHSVSGTLLLKIDVEGAELDVLKGAKKTLAMCDVVIMETWINMPLATGAGDFASIVAFMKEHSFVVFDFFGGHSYPSGILNHVDTVFVKENSPYREIIKTLK